MRHFNSGYRQTYKLFIAGPSSFWKMQELLPVSKKKRNRIFTTGVLYAIASSLHTRDGQYTPSRATDVHIQDDIYRQDAHAKHVPRHSVLRQDWLGTFVRCQGAQAQWQHKDGMCQYSRDLAAMLLPEMKIPRSCKRGCKATVQQWSQDMHGQLRSMPGPYIHYVRQLTGAQRRMHFKAFLTSCSRSQSRMQSFGKFENDYWNKRRQTDILLRRLYTASRTLQKPRYLRHNRCRQGLTARLSCSTAYNYQTEFKEHLQLAVMFCTYFQVHDVRGTCTVRYCRWCHRMAQRFFPSASTSCFQIHIAIYWMPNNNHSGSHGPAKEPFTWPLAGPPCETWSVSRLRWYEDGEGPRPLRDGGRLQDSIWGLPQLRLREARQVRVANALLQFCILLFLAQVLSAGIAIIEHPDQPGQRGMLVPPSIWILPIMQFIQSASTVHPIHIKQGYWNAISPKPTLLLTTIPATSGAAILKCLEGFQVRDTLPPPLPMGRASKTTYNTAVLKRYPRALCRAIAEIAGKFASSVPFTYAHTDEVQHVAQVLRRIYMTTSDQMDDGNDFAGDRN